MNTSKQNKYEDINDICIHPPCGHDCDDGDDDGDGGDGLCFDVAKFKIIFELARKITPNVGVIAPRSVHPINV